MYAESIMSHRAAALRPIAAGNTCANVSAFPAPADHDRTETFRPGQTIFHEGSDATFYFQVVSGTVRCCGLTADGRRQIYRFACGGEMLGLGGEAVYNHSAEAVTAVTVRRHRLSALDAAMARDERLRERVVKALRDELNAVRTQMMLLGRMTAAERIVTFLRDLSRRSGSADGFIDLAMTRSDIADYLGLTLETVSRKINALKRSGAIELTTPSRVRITDPDRLEAMAEAA